jgi:protein TonB
VTAFAIHAGQERRGAVRWSLSAILIVALHGALLAFGLAWPRPTNTPGAAVPTILIDMSPVSAAPEPQQVDVAPGPQMTEADAPSAPPEQAVQAAPKLIAPTPLQDKPEVEAPPEQMPQPTPEKWSAQPEPAKPMPKPPVKPKPVQPVKKPSERPPAPRTSAAPSAATRAPQAAAMAGAAAAAALPTYRQILAAHLQRFKQYPAAAKSSGISGTAMLTFTVTRSGGVSGARLSASSGHAALDAETMAMIRRAQPLPAFLPQMTQSSLSFTVPVRFSLGN